MKQQKEEQRGLTCVEALIHVRLSLLGSQVNKTADVRPEPQQDDQQAQKVEDQCDNLEGQQEGSVIKAAAPPKRVITIMTMRV